MLVTVCFFNMIIIWYNLIQYSIPYPNSVLNFMLMKSWRSFSVNSRLSSLFGCRDVVDGNEELVEMNLFLDPYQKDDNYLDEP